MRDEIDDWLDGEAPPLPEIDGLETEAAKLAKDNAEISEARLAEGFARAFAGKLAYAHDAGLWMRFDGAAWRPERRRLAYHFAVEYCRAANTKGEKRLEKAATADAVEKIARARPELAVETTDFDPDPLLLGTPGGVVDLTDGSRRPGLASDRISKLTAVKPESGAPSRWLTFLHEATGGDADLIRFLRQWCGYCLTGLTREHALLFVYGPGGNGKSVFINIVSRILAEYATTAPMETFAASHNDPHPTGLAMLRGARLVCASETEEGRAWAESRIKAITGGDPITARFMRQDFFTFTPHFKLTIAGNHQPVLRNVDDAARRRFNIVPFTRKPAQPDPELETKLWDEAPHILQWMIDGAIDWLEHGLLRPASVTKATADYFSTQDTFGQWLDEKCRVEPDNRHLSELTAKLFESWSGFAKECGEPAGTAKSFAGLMQKRGLTPERIHRLGRGYRGIEMKGKSYAGY